MPSIEYISPAEFAVTVIEPSFLPQPVGFVFTTLLMVGGLLGCVTVTGADVVIQVVPKSRTRTVYEPAAKFIKKFDDIQFVPSMLYSSPPTPVAPTMIFPSLPLQSVVAVGIVAFIIGAVGATILTIG